MKGKNILALAVSAMLLLGLCACQGAPQNAAVVNGMLITMEDFIEQVNLAFSSYQVTYDQLEEIVGKEQADLYKQEILDDMIIDELLLQKAELWGLDHLTDEEEAEAQRTIENSIKMVKQQIRDQVLTQAASDSTIDVEAKTQEQFDAFMTDNGYTAEALVEFERIKIIKNKAYEKAIEGFIFDESGIKSYYDANLPSQKEAAESTTDDPLSVYKTRQVDLYVPTQAVGEVRLIKHVLIKIPDEVSAEIDVISNETDKKARQDAALADIKPKAEQVLAQVSTKNFDTLIKEHGEDPGMASYPAGYKVYEGASFVESFLNAALALKKVGDTSGLIASDYGYHILQYAADPVPGQISLEDATPSIRVVVENTQKEEYWTRAYTAWMDEATIERFVK